MKAFHALPASAGAYILVTTMLAGTLHAQEMLPTLGDLHDAGARLVEEMTGGEYTLDTEIVSDEATRAWFGELASSLEDTSLAGLAALLPGAQSALENLQEYEALAPYAEWLQQQMDYLEVADRSFRAFPAEPPATAKPGKAAPPDPAQQRRDRYVTSNRVWEDRLRGRPLPERAGELVPRLKPVFARHGVPAELVWLAEVESSFRPSARSPAGAAGLYQFMPKTAESLGLKLRPRDERLVPEKSAGAAATYLKTLYRRFDNWPLALAAYNGGQGRVSGLLKKHRGRRFEDIAAHLPSETRMYVPKVLATIKLREGIDAAHLPPPT